MKTLPNPTEDGRCTNCGVSDFILAEDHTEYSPCEFDREAKTFSTTYGHTQESEAENAVRFYCANCGTPHMRPDGLS